MQLVALSGSPSARSRSAWLLRADVVQLRPPAREPTPLDRAVGKQARHVGLGAVPIVAIIFGAVLWALVLRFLLSL